MDLRPQDTIIRSNGDSDLQALRERLRKMTVNQLLQELDELTKQAEDVGEELDPHIVLVYYDVLDEIDPVPVPMHAKKTAKKMFSVNYPEYIGVRSESACLPQMRRIFGRLRSRRVVVLAAVLVAFTLSGAVVALEVPRSLITWAEKTFSFGLPSGSDMRLETPTEEGFYTLDDALHYNGVSTYTPQWIPARFKLDDISVSENDAWTSYIAIFSPLQEASDSCMIKITNFKEGCAPPDITYEDNGVENRDIREIGNLTVQITENMDLYRITCSYANCLLSITGTFSDKEVDQIIEHITLDTERMKGE